MLAMNALPASCPVLKSGNGDDVIAFVITDEVAVPGALLATVEA